MDAKVLEQVGLTKGEARIYVALLELGQSTTGPIVDKSGVSTSKTYKILKRLERKGMVSHVIKKSVMHWAPANPHRIVELLEQQENELLQKKKEIEKLMPELMKTIQEKQETQQAEVYMGIKGMISVFNDETEYLKEHPAEVNYILGVTTGYSEQTLSFFKRLEQKRTVLKIKEKFLAGEDARGTMSFVEKSKYATVKYLPFSSIVSINVYGETSFISVFSAEPIFFVIKSKETADSFKAYFELLWKQAKA